MTERFWQNGEVFEVVIGRLMTMPYNSHHHVLLPWMNHHSTDAFDWMWRFSDIPTICLTAVSRRQPFLQSMMVDCNVRRKHTRKRTINPINESRLDCNSCFIPVTRLFVEFVGIKSLPILLLRNATIHPIDTEVSVMSGIVLSFIKSNLIIGEWESDVCHIHICQETD